MQKGLRFIRECLTPVNLTNSKEFLKERGREKGKKASPGGFLGGEENIQTERTGMNTLTSGNKEVPKKETNQKNKFISLEMAEP